MRFLSALLSAAGLLSWITAIIRFVSATPEGVALRWDQLGLWMLVGLGFFVLAWRVAPRG